MTTIGTILEAAKIARYYVNGYAEAEKSDILDRGLFATIAEQKAYFAARVAQYGGAFRGDLIALRVLYAEQLRTAGPEEKPAIEAQITSLERELSRPQLECR